MVTIINTPGNTTGSDSSVGVVVGIVLAIAIIILFVVYGIPALRGNAPAAAPAAGLNVNLQAPAAPANQ